MTNGQSLGSAGELLAQAALLRRGWTTANVNSGGMMNAPAIDLVAMKGQRNIRIAVKSSGARGAMQWGVKDDWQSLSKARRIRILFSSSGLTAQLTRMPTGCSSSPLKSPTVQRRKRTVFTTATKPKRARRARV